MLRVPAFLVLFVLARKSLAADKSPAAADVDYCDSVYLGLRQTQCLLKSESVRTIVADYATIGWPAVSSAIDMQLEEVEDALKAKKSTKLEDVIGALAMPLLFNMQLQPGIEFPDAIFKTLDKRPDETCLVVSDAVRCGSQLLQVCDGGLREIVRAALQMAPKQVFGFNLQSEDFSEKRLMSFIDAFKALLPQFVPSKCPPGGLELIGGVSCIERASRENKAKCLAVVGDDEAIVSDIQARLKYGALWFLTSLRIQKPDAASCPYYMKMAQCLFRQVESKCTDASPMIGLALIYGKTALLKGVCDS